MLIGWLVSAAFADPPDHEARLWRIGDGTGGYVERMAVSPSGNVLAGRTRGDLKGWLVDLDSWTLATFGGAAAGCEVTGVAPVPLEYGNEEVWMSCADGSVRGVTWDGTTATDVVDEAGDPIVFTAIDDTLSGIWYDIDSFLLYAVYAPSDDYDVLHAIDPFALTYDNQASPSYPKTLLDKQFVEGVQTTDGKLVIAHGGENVSWIQLGVDSATPQHNQFAGKHWCDDLAPSPLGGAYCVGTDGQPGSLGDVSEFLPATNLWVPIDLGEVPDPNAICANLQKDLDGNLVDGWLAVTGLQVKVWKMDGQGGIPSIVPYFEGPPDADNPIQDMVTSDGYLFGGGTEGNLHVDTARPWVYPELASVTPTGPSGAGTPITVKFQVDTDADWELDLHGSRIGDGTQLASGSTSADTDVTADLIIDGGYDEGDNFLYAIATDAKGLTGYARVTVSVDNPPQPPKLTDANLAFSDGALVLDFQGIRDLDLSHYDVYVTQTLFDGADYPNGGPDFDGTTSLKTPLTLTSSPGDRVTTRIHPLENGVTYYVGIRSWDTGGKEGPMSKVISGMPRLTLTAAELDGETGGTPCSTGPSPASWWIAGAAAVGLATRRRKARGAAMAALALGTLAVSATAQAADDGKEPWWKADTTPEHANFEMRYGVISLRDKGINNVYRDNPDNLLSAEFGPQIFHIGEVDFGFGFFQELAYTVTPGDFVQSGDRTMLTWWPLYVDGTLRGQILDEQPVVPFVRYGWDYVIWNEQSDNAAGGKDKLSGGKFGTHESLGVNLLLDLLQPGRASFLEARTGINDSWLTIEWRHQTVDDRARPWSGPRKSGFDFSGNALQIGLKLDW